jgi:hypothetical protein
MPVIPVLRRLRQEDSEFKDSMDYTVKPCLKKQKQNEVAPLLGKGLLHFQVYARQLYHVK